MGIEDRRGRLRASECHALSKRQKKFAAMEPAAADTLEGDDLFAQLVQDDANEPLLPPPTRATRSRLSAGGG